VWKKRGKSTFARLFGAVGTRRSVFSPSNPTIYCSILPMLNRKSSPVIHEVRHLTLPKPKTLRLDNGILVYVLDYPEQEILKLEAVYRAGRPEEEKKLAARATSRLIREGTLTKSGAEIAEHLDFYGASLSVPTNLDTASFVLFGLKKYATEILPVFAELLQSPSFPELELENFRRNSIQELLVELEKGETVAYRKVTELIYGEHHPYGYNSFPEDYVAIQRADLLHFYQTWYTPSNCLLFATGRIDDQVIELLNRHFGQLGKDTRATVPPRLPIPPNPPAPRRKAPVRISLPGSLQTAIKIGRRLFDRNHPDYNGMVVLNTVLGGYFGSRLMTNIREKKGYTYNIYSTVDGYLHDGCLYIATEVSPEKSAAAVRAIFSELKKLRENPIPAEELSMVRNYILGMLLNGLDGPLNSSDLLRNQIVENQGVEKFEALVQTVRDISPEVLQGLAQQYLQQADFWVVTVD